jgi:hypothetical protein
MGELNVFTGLVHMSITSAYRHVAEEDYGGGEL